MAMELRKAYRLTKEQDEELKRKVAAAGMTESEFIRLMITEQPKDFPEIRAMLDRLINEVNRIGVNINEIVYNNNSMLYKEQDKQRLIAYMRKLNELLKGRVKEIGDNKDPSYR
ncbi:MAG: plasmid mobilization relaxosome protein MobC [Eubacterium sp.]|nr:plasmid mobilization relaxosome protein MobC [Eubacterium sp.]